MCLRHYSKEPEQPYLVSRYNRLSESSQQEVNLGHATAAFTLDVYGHVTDQMKRDSADRMQKFIQSISSQ